jgi:hypothetical protein
VTSPCSSQPVSEFERGRVAERERVTRIIREQHYDGESASDHWAAWNAALNALLVALGVEDTKSAVNEERA